MIKCKDCRHWDQTDNYREAKKKFKNKYGDCINPKVIDAGNLLYKIKNSKEPIPTDFLIFSDPEGYELGISTGEDFGCINGERNQ